MDKITLVSKIHVLIGEKCIAIKVIITYTIDTKLQYFIELCFLNMYVSINSVYRLVVEPNYADEEEDFPFTTTIYMSRPNDCVMDWDISEHMNGFNSMFLIYMKDIREIDISGCSAIPTLNFIDCIGACQNLKILKMKACMQFTELHLMQMLPQLKRLNYLCLEECQEISFPVAFWIVSSLPQLLNIDFEPKNREIELKDWKRFFHTFFRVQFGIAFRRILPNYGLYVRLPAHANF